MIHGVVCLSSLLHLGAGDACQFLSRADASAWSLPLLKIYCQSKRHFLVVPFLSMYRTIFVSHDGDELPGMSDVRMVQIFLGICHFGLEETIYLSPDWNFL